MAQVFVRTSPLGALALCISLLASPLAAHEVWIDALRWQVAPSQPISANLRNGQVFEGIRLPWLPKRLRQAVVQTGGTVRDMEGRAGDLPAFAVETDAPGLVVLGYESQPSTLTYTDYPKFASFAEEKGHAAVIADAPQEARPREAYTRHAKALIGVGDAQGADQALGFEIELVAETNPYTAPKDPMQVRLIYQDAALAETRVTLFDKDPEGAVTVSTMTTNAEGRVRFDTAPGHVYLVDAVMLRPATDAMAPDVSWESLWASLTFAVP